MFPCRFVHLPPHVRIDGKRQRLQKKASIERDGFKINLLGVVVCKALARFGKSYKSIHSSATLYAIHTRITLTDNIFLEKMSLIGDRSHNKVVFL